MKKEINIELTPDELAEMFINWGSDEQGTFLNLVGTYFKKVDFNHEMQCAYIVDEIDKSGRDFIYTIANFLKVRSIPSGSPKENHLINIYKDNN